MGRILGIDYGLKRTGIAATDPLKIIASPLETVETENLLNHLKLYFEKEEVEQVVIGMPIDVFGNDTHSTAEVKQFIINFKKQFEGIPIAEMDERFTSKLAMDAMLQGNAKKSQRSKKENIDKLSATIILQDYLQTIENKR